MLPEPWEYELTAGVAIGILGESDREYLQDQLNSNLALAGRYRDTVGVDVGAAYAMGNAGRIYQSLGRFQEARACYAAACE